MGTPMANVPADYLLHAYADFDPEQWADVKNYVRENMDVLEKEALEQNDEFTFHNDDFID